MEDLILKLLLGGGGLAAFFFAVRHLGVAYIQRNKGRAMTIKGVDADGRGLELTFTDHSASEEALLLESFTPQLIPVRVQRKRTNDNGSAVPTLKS